MGGHAKKWRWRAMAAATAICIAAPALLASERTLHVGVYHNPPKVIVADEGPPTGFWPELTRHIAEQEDYTLTWRSGDWSEMLAALENGDIDLLVDVAHSPERAARLLLGEQTVHSSWSRIYTVAGSAIETIPQLAGRRIAVLSDSINIDGEGGIAPLLASFGVEAELLAQPDYLDVFEAVAQGEADAGVVNRDFGHRMQDAFGLAPTPILLQPAELRYGFSRADPQAPALRDTFDRQLGALKADNASVYHTLLEDWLGPTTSRSNVLPTWVLWSLLALLITAVLLAANLVAVELRVRARTRELRRRDQMLATSQRLARIGSWELDPATMRLIWTEETFRIMGLAAEDGAPSVEGFFDMVEPDDVPKMRAALDNMLKGGPDRDLVFRVHRPDGRIRYLHERAEAEHDRHGRVQLLHGTVQDITEWRQLDEHVHAFQELLEGSEDLCSVYDDSFRYVWVNAAYSRWFGLDQYDILGRHLAEIIGQEHFERDIRPAFERCLNGQSQRIETLRRDRKGIERPIMARYYPIPDADGRIARVGAVITDLSELKAAETRAQQQAHLIDMAGRAARLGAWTVELPDQQPLWSDLMAEIHGMPPGYSPPLEEGIQFYAPEYRERIRALYTACVERGEAFDEEFQILNADNERIWVRTLGEPVHDETGRIVRVQGALQDISARKQAEAEASRLEKNLRQTMASISEAFFTLDQDWRFTYANPAAEHIAGRQAEDVIGRKLWDTFPEVIGTAWEGAYRRAMEQRVTVEIEDYYAPFEKWLYFRAYPISEGLAVYLLDITERRELLEHLRQSYTSLSALLDSRRALINSLPAHIALLDAEGNIIDVNERWRHFAQQNHFAGSDFGIGSNYIRVCEQASGDCAEEAEPAANGLRELLSGKRESFSLEYPCHSPDHPRWFRLTANRLRDDTGSEIGSAVVMHVDITERRLAEEQLTRLAFEDPVTGLYTRNGFLRALNERLFGGSWPETAIVVGINIKGMRDINDALGFDAGDRLLRVFGSRLEAQNAAHCIAGHTGGDEFVLYLEIDSAETVETALERLTATLTEAITIDEVSIEVSTRIGYTRLGEQSRAVATLLREAEVALAEHRDHVERPWIAFSTEMDAADTRRIEMTRELRQALKAGEFELHYQPKLRLKDGQIHSCEALLRWHHPHLGMILPGRFIGIAEKSQLIGPIGDWILRESCRQLRAWLDAGVQPVRVAVNVSLAQFMANDMAARVQALLQEFVLPGELLALEITESIFERSFPGLKEQLEKLRAIGVRLSLDDFGTGYSSLLYLQKYRFDEIKIDRGFVLELLKDNYSRNIVRVIIDMAHTFGAEVVAEGIESEAIRQALLGISCSLGQGRYFSYPLPGDAMQELLAERPAFPLSPERTRITM